VISNPLSRFAGLPPYCRVVLIVTAVAGGWLLAGMAGDFLAQGIPARLADRDFANYWTAARLTLEGRTADLFGPQPVYFAHLQAAFGVDYPWHNWSYPPHFLLLVWPLGFFGYKAAFLLFMAVTSGLFVWALRDFAGKGNTVAWIAAAPFMVHNFWIAQNGYLTAALGLGALALRDRRPVLAGVLLGLLTVKPQLGLLFPILLLAERNWRAIAGAAVTTLVLVAASAILFGIDAWRGYLGEVLPYQTFVMRELDGIFLAMMPSVFGALRNWGFGADPALIVHLVVAVPVAAVAVALIARSHDKQARAAVLLVATFAVTPYALSYDLGLFAAGVAVVAVARPSFAASAGGTVLFSLAMLLPLVMMPLGALGISIAPLVVLAIFVLAARQAGFPDILFARRVGETVKPRKASPVAASD